MDKEKEVEELADMLKQSADSMKIGEDSTESVARFLIEKGYSLQTLVPLDRKTVFEAIAQAYSMDANLHKDMDFDLVHAIGMLILERFGTPPALTVEEIEKILLKDWPFTRKSLAEDIHQRIYGGKEK